MKGYFKKKTTAESSTERNHCKTEQETLESRICKKGLHWFKQMSA